MSFIKSINDGMDDQNHLILAKDTDKPTGFQRVPKKFRMITIAILNVITNVIMNVSLPVFAGTMTSPEVGGDAFVLLIQTSITVTVIFAVMTMVVRYSKLDPTASLRPTASWKVLFAMGLFTTLNGILVVNASPPDRTPPYLQGILSATVIPYTVVCRLIILRKGTFYMSYMYIVYLKLLNNI